MKATVITAVAATILAVSPLVAEKMPYTAGITGVKQYEAPSVDVVPMTDKEAMTMCLAYTSKIKNIKRAPVFSLTEKECNKIVIRVKKRGAYCKKETYCERNVREYDAMMSISIGWMEGLIYNKGMISEDIVFAECYYAVSSKKTDWTLRNQIPSVRQKSSLYDEVSDLRDEVESLRDELSYR